MLYSLYLVLWYREYFKGSLHGNISEFLVTNNFYGGKLHFRIHIYITKYSGRHVAHIVVHLLYVLVYNTIKPETQQEGPPLFKFAISSCHIL